VLTLKAKTAPFVAFFDEKVAINYLLFRCCYKAANPNQLKKTLLKRIRKYNGIGVKWKNINFPIPNDLINGFLLELGESGLKDGFYIHKSVLPLYFGSLNNASLSNDYNTDDLVESIHGFQKKFGSEVIPTERKITMEYCITNTIYFKTTLRLYFS
jgi:hypothetical protein